MIPKCRPLIAGGLRCGGVALPLCLCIDLKLNVNCGNSNDARGKEQLPAGTSTRATMLPMLGNSGRGILCQLCLCYPSSCLDAVCRAGASCRSCPGFLLNHATAIKPRCCSHCNRVQPVSLTRRQSCSYGQWTMSRVLSLVTLPDNQGRQYQPAKQPSSRRASQPASQHVCPQRTGP